MKEDQEIRAKALEIAIGLTKADHTWFQMEDNGYISMKEPLFTTFETVMAIMQADDLEELRHKRYRLVPREAASAAIA